MSACFEIFTMYLWKKKVFLCSPIWAPTYSPETITHISANPAGPSKTHGPQGLTLSGLFWIGLRWVTAIVEWTTAHHSAHIA